MGDKNKSVHLGRDLKRQFGELLANKALDLVDYWTHNQGKLSRLESYRCRAASIINIAISQKGKIPGQKGVPSPLSYEVLIHDFMNMTKATRTQVEKFLSEKGIYPRKE